MVKDNANGLKLKKQLDAKIAQFEYCLESVPTIIILFTLGLLEDDGIEMIVWVLVGSSLTLNPIASLISVSDGVHFVCTFYLKNQKEDISIHILEYTCFYRMITSF